MEYSHTLCYCIFLGIVTKGVLCDSDSDDSDENSKDEDYKRYIKAVEFKAPVIGAYSYNSMKQSFDLGSKSTDSPYNAAGGGSTFLGDGTDTTLTTNSTSKQPLRLRNNKKSKYGRWWPRASGSEEGTKTSAQTTESTSTVNVTTTKATLWDKSTKTFNREVWAKALGVNDKWLQ